MPDREPARAVLLEREICDAERRDLRDPEHRVRRDRDDGRVTKARERAPIGKGGREVGLVPSHARDLSPAAAAALAPETGDDPGDAVPASFARRRTAATTCPATAGERPVSKSCAR